MGLLINSHRGSSGVANASLILPAGVYIDSGNTVAEVDVYPIGVSMRVKGLRLSDPGASFAGGTLMELMAGYFSVEAADLGTAFVVLEAKSVGISAGSYQASKLKASIDPAAWYIVRAWHDTAESVNKQGIELWTDALALTAFAYGTDTVAIPAPTTFHYMRLGTDGNTPQIKDLEIDWIALWSGKGPTPASTAKPVLTDAGIIDVWGCDEGSGSTITSDGAVVLTATGANSWGTP